jgi:VIT1/CCC1 family predicted Fe2+/Mn2+ transporter
MLRKFDNKNHALKDSISSIVLGVNDGLIELTGALVGFSFALRDLQVVALAGLIVGLAAALSMAASAFMQARSEHNKDPLQAATATGLSYLAVVLILIAPFFFFARIMFALIAMLVLSVVIIAAMTKYISIRFGRSWLREFKIMLILSLGVSAITFAIGTLLRKINSSSENSLPTS